MKRIITVKEFCTQFLEPLQNIRIVDMDNDYVYFRGNVSAIMNSDQIVYSARLQFIREFHGLTEKSGIDLYI